MNTNSINDKNGCSTCEEGKENYTIFIAGAFKGTEYYQYDYRHTNGEVSLLSPNRWKNAENSVMNGLQNWSNGRRIFRHYFFHDFAK